MPEEDQVIPPEVLEELKDREQELMARESMVRLTAEVGSEAEKRDIMQELRSRAKRLVNYEDLSEDEIRKSEEAADRSMEEIQQAIREERGRNWDEKVPPIWSKWNMEALPPGLRNAANQWIANGFNEGNNLILAGPTGTGKTAMAYAVGRKLYTLDHKVKVWKMAELFDEMRNQEQSKVVLASVKDADLLILDDVGSERKTDWIEERLYMIVDHRYEWQKPVIVTTNFTKQELSEQVSSRVLERLLHKATFLTVEGKNYRA